MTCPTGLTSTLLGVKPPEPGEPNCSPTSQRVVGAPQALCSAFGEMKSRLAQKEQAWPKRSTAATRSGSSPLNGSVRCGRAAAGASSSADSNQPHQALLAPARHRPRWVTWLVPSNCTRCHPERRKSGSSMPLPRLCYGHGVTPRFPSPPRPRGCCGASAPGAQHEPDGLESAWEQDIPPI